MLKKPITYTDFNGDTVTETFYFNLTQTEVLDMEWSIEGGLSESFKKIVDSADQGALFKEFKKFILAAYGQKSDDGKRFVKNDDIRNEFAQTAAFDTLIMEFVTNSDKAEEFISAVVPKQVADKMSKATDVISTATAKAAMSPQDPAFAAMQAAAGLTGPTLPPPSA